MAAYLEQSTRYIYFDTKNSEGNYKYYVPVNLDKKTYGIYRQTMDQLFGQYSKLVHNLTTYVQSVSSSPKDERDGAWQAATRAQACDVARPILPVATTSTVGIFASGQALESLIMHLQSDRLSEAKQVGDQMLVQARKVMPAFLERADKPDRGGAIVAYRANTYKEVDNLVKKYIKETYAQDQPPVVLTDYWPKNELDIVADMIYEHSNLSLSEIDKIISTWPYDRKLEVFKAYMGERLNRRHRPGRALEKVHYSWDLICDYGIFRDLQRHRMVDDLEWQVLTPRFGYDTPKLVEQAGESELFDESFDTSLQLHSLLLKQGYETEAQYATLLGHKMRWKVTYNAREAFHLHEIRTSPQGHPGYRKLIQQMHEKVGEVHPLMAESMKFVNQGEDPELNRLAAERYTQFKLKNTTE
jgi:thymidylate synthase ThyX